MLVPIVLNFTKKKNLIQSARKILKNNFLEREQKMIEFFISL